MSDHWSEIEATAKVRVEAVRLLRRHSLRAAVALQLAAAQVLTDGDQGKFPIVTLDQRLREAAQREGFSIVP